MYFCEELLHFFKDIVMKMSPSVAQQYTQEHLSALQAQRLAHEIAFTPVVFQVWLVCVLRYIPIPALSLLTARRWTGSEAEDTDSE